MPAIFYTEPETGFRYALLVTGEDASMISATNPDSITRIVLPSSGEIIDFDGTDTVTITTPKFKHSFALATEFVAAAREIVSRTGEK